MAGKRVGAAVTLQPCEEQALRGHIKSAAAGKTDLTVDEIVDLLCSAFPQSYTGSNSQLLAERVAKITPLPCRRGDAIDKPTPVTNKRQKIVETRSATRQNKVLNASIPDFSLEESCGSLNSDGDLGESDELGDDSRERNKNGKDGRRDVNGINRAIIGDLGHGTREMNENGDNVNGNNRPMFRDLWGMHNVMIELMTETILPLLQLKLLRRLGVESIPRILLHGPTGCGKTTLARAIANEVGLPLFEISAAELVSRVSGAPQENIRELFSTAYMRAPSIVFIDEIDAMTSKTESLQKEIQPHLVNQLMACMDEPYSLIRPVNYDADSESSNSRPAYVLVIGATNRLDALDPALRRRFDREIVIGAPSNNTRWHILSALTCNLKVEDGLDLAKLAWCTLGFVAGDLVALVKKASMLAVNRIIHVKACEAYNKQRGDKVQCKDYYKQPFHDEELENVSITVADFVEAAKKIRPSSRLEGFSTTPNVKWDDVGGLQLLKLEFERHIVKRIKFPKVYKDLVGDLTTAFLLYGPSGCGKTLIVEALANEAGANFLHIKGPTLLGFSDRSKLVVHIIFNYARAHPPCIVFFDQLEAIIRDGGNGRLPHFEQLLSSLSCAEETSGVYVICATNSPKVVSYLASTSEEYFDKHLYVPLPGPEERGAILKALARNKPIDADVDLMALGKDIACENLNGVDLSDLMKQAIKAAIDRPTLSGGGHSVPWTIKDVDFKKALPKISPSVSSSEMKNWKELNAYRHEESDVEW